MYVTTENEVANITNVIGYIKGSVEPGIDKGTLSGLQGFQAYQFLILETAKVSDHLENALVYCIYVKTRCIF